MSAATGRTVEAAQIDMETAATVDEACGNSGVHVQSSIGPGGSTLTRRAGGCCDVIEPGLSVALDGPTVSDTTRASPRLPTGVGKPADNGREKRGRTDAYRSDGQRQSSAPTRARSRIIMRRKFVQLWRIHAVHPVVDRFAGMSESDEDVHAEPGRDREVLFRTVETDQCQFFSHSKQRAIDIGTAGAEPRQCSSE